MLDLCILKLAMKSETNILEQFGLTVKRLRVELKLSQEELGQKAGMHRTYVGMVERAEKNLTLSNVEKLANGLGISIADLFKEL